MDLSSKKEDAVLELDDLFGQDHSTSKEVIRYGNLTLGVVPKQGKSNALLADAIFNSAFAMTEWFETLAGVECVAGQTVLELGSSSGLPSIYLSTTERPPSLVVLSDYPSDEVLNVTKANVRVNAHLSRCPVKVVGYAWEDDVDPLLCAAQAEEGVCGFKPGHLESGKLTVLFSILMSDLLWLSQSHADLVRTIASCLSKKATSRVYIFSGTYTRQEDLDSFFEMTKDLGLVNEALDLHSKPWQGTVDILGLPFDSQESEVVKRAMEGRRSAVRGWIVRWE